MTAAPPLATISVGVLVERSKGLTQWTDFYWRPVGVLAGVPSTPPWTKLSDDGERAQFYAGTAEIELHRTETTNYRDNLASGQPSLWVALRPAEGQDPPYTLLTVTADPAEGEGLTEAGSDLIEAVPMPPAVAAVIAQFIAEHHVERVFVKRKRDRANPEALGRRGRSREDAS
jgi:hypothetical protein